MCVKRKAVAVLAAITMSSAGPAFAYDLGNSEWQDFSAQVVSDQSSLPIFSRPALASVVQSIPATLPGEPSSTNTFGDLARFEARATGTPKGALANSEIYPGTELGAAVGKGMAAWYKHSGRTATGEIFDPKGLSAAHATLPLGTPIRVVNERNGKAVVVIVNDRMTTRPTIRRRFAIELSQGGAEAIGMAGIAPVQIFAAQPSNVEKGSEQQAAEGLTSNASGAGIQP